MVDRSPVESGACSRGAAHADDVFYLASRRPTSENASTRVIYLKLGDDARKRETRKLFDDALRGSERRARDHPHEHELTGSAAPEVRRRWISV